jgi:hypothetical protein
MNGGCRKAKSKGLAGYFEFGKASFLF